MVLFSITGNGTFYIGGLFNFYHVIKHGQERTAKINSQTGIAFSEAMRFALDKINNDSNLLYGFKIAPKIVDVTSIRKLIRHNIIPGYLEGEMPCAIGPMLSRDAYELAILSNSINYPLVSYYASFHQCLPIMDRDFSFLYRTVSSDSFRILAMLDVVKALQWNYVVIICSYGLNGDAMARDFITELQKIDVSVYKYWQLGVEPTENHYNTAVRYVSDDIRARALLLFTTNEDSAGVLRALSRANLTTKFQILASNGFANYVEVASGNEDIAEGAISIEYATQEIAGFRDYFLKLNPKTRVSKEFRDFWESTFQCSLTSSSSSSTLNCTGQERLQPGKGYYSGTPVHLVINAVYSMAHAYKHIVKKNCLESENSCKTDTLSWHRDAKDRFANDTRNYFQANSYPDLTLNIASPYSSNSNTLVAYDILNYVKDGSSYQNVKIGHWSMKRGNLSLPGTVYRERGAKGYFEFNVSRVRFKGEKGKVMSCLPCQPGKKMLRNSQSDLPSCWSCQNCPKNHIIVNNTCIRCPKDFKPDEDFLICIAIPVKYLSVRSNTVISILLAVSVIGLVLTVITTIIFLKNSNNRVVRASGRELCYFMLVGIGLVFITPIFFTTEPGMIVCILRDTFPGLAFVMCYAPLFLKTNRVYRIFRNAQTSITTPPLISPQSQLLILAGIIGIQILFGIVWAVYDGSKQLETHPYIPESRAFLVDHCGNNALPLMMNLIASFAFMIASTWFAFRTRNFPKNYNEAKYIGFTMYITCILWAIFLPTYFITKEDDSYRRQLIKTAVYILIGYTTLIGIFGRKLRILLCFNSKDLQTKNTRSSSIDCSSQPWRVQSTMETNDSTNGSHGKHPL